MKGKKKRTPKDFIDEIVEVGSANIGIAADDFRAVVEKGKSKTYAAGTWLFHESTPRLWLGIVQRGKVEIVRGLHGSEVRLASLGRGAIIGEGALLDDSAHSTGAFAPQGAVVHEIPRRALEELRRNKPDVFYRIVAQVARRMSDRLRYTSEKLLAAGAPEYSLQNVRREHTSLVNGRCRITPTTGCRRSAPLRTSPSPAPRSRISGTSSMPSPT
jgi:aspartate ammonia-lyase